MATDVIAECAGKINYFYVRIGDIEAMLKNVDACADCGLGELYLADILLGKINSGSMAFVSEDKGRAIGLSNCAYTFRDR